MRLRDLVVGAVVLSVSACDRGESDCTKLWKATDALRDFGYREACKHDGRACPPRDKAGELKQYLTKCERMPAAVTRCLLKDDDEMDSACREQIDRCEADPACRDAMR